MSDTESDYEPVVKKSGKKVEDIYKKTNLREHILNRPDSYIGTLEPETAKLFVCNEDATKFVQRDVRYAPGLLKIFDEILVNAADNKQRDPIGMNELRVEVNKARNLIAVWNNGQGIPIQIHKEYNIYVPELIFGQLLTSSNYDDSEKRTVGGRNGFGAKLANIFSKSFTVETCDGKQYYRQTFSNNMQDKTEPKIEKAEERRSWTRITFQPDLKRFGMKELEDDIIALIQKRTYDIAGTSGKGLKVAYNNKSIPIKDFKSYCEMHLDTPQDLIYEQISDRWEIGIAPSDGMQQVSFVNRINTFRGGTHVNSLMDQVVKVLGDAVNKKQKKHTLKPQHFKNHVWIFVNSLIENPTFDTQTKVNLTSQKKDFGSNPKISDGFEKKIAKSAIVKAILSFAQFQESKDLKKTDAKKKSQRLIGIQKLNDANFAGGPRSKECTLILTEGDSAKALAVSGVNSMGERGRQFYGVFPLRGKVLNVRDTPTATILKNEEITNLKQILGLQQGKTYTDTKDLRYGRIMIMTDQDPDGSHIKGLLINLFAHFWPSLLKMRGFLTEFITPIVKVSRKANVSQDPKAKQFFTLQEYEQWRQEANDGKGFNIKYYKGLGTSTSIEAKQYFSRMDRHNIDFAFKDEKCTKLIEMAFSKSTADDRKIWIQGYQPGTFLDHTQKPIYYQDFINKELVIFSIASNERAIPSVVDGLKPSERKILFSCFKRNLQREIKVAQLVGYVAEHSAYHHGEASLSQTIIALAQNFVGSNNINYLWPSGQFGTRAGGGKDAASARYIFTYLSPITRKIFHPQDDALLTYRNDDGQSIEPDYYVPIIPTVLVNGSSGIGTGWSSEIFNHNPREIVQNIRKMINGEEPEEMHPWYKGFIGEVAVRPSGKQYYVRGLFDIVDSAERIVHVYELPIGQWTGDYKTFLEELMKDGTLADLAEYHTDTTVSFSITFSDVGWKKAQTQGMKSFLKLETSKSSSNMVLFDAQGKIKKYNSTTEILKDFYDLRLGLYAKRKEHLIATKLKELNRIDNKVRFIRGVIKEEITIRNVKRDRLLQQLEDMKFDKIYPQKTDAEKSMGIGEEEENDAAEDEDDSDDDSSDSDAGSKNKKKLSAKKQQDPAYRMKGYTYLTSLPLMQLTYEKVMELEKERNNLSDQLEMIRKKTAGQMWEEDLDLFEEALVDHERREEGNFDGGAGKKGKRGAKLTHLDDYSDESEDDSDDDDSDADYGKKKKGKKTTAKGKAAAASAKGKQALPEWVRKAMLCRPKEQSITVEEETELEKKKRLKQQAKMQQSIGDVADLLGLDAELMGDGTTPVVTATTKKPAATRGKKKAASVDDEDDITPKPTTAAAKKATAASKKAAMKDDDDDSDVDFGAKKKPAAKTTKASSATTKAAAAPKSRGKKKMSDSETETTESEDETTDFITETSDDDDDDDDSGSDSGSGDDDDDDDDGSGSGSDDDDDDDSEEEFAPPPKKAPAARGRSTSATRKDTTTATAPKRKAAIIDSEDDEEEIKPIVKKQKTAPAASKAKKMIDSEDDEDEVVSLAAPKRGRGASQSQSMSQQTQDDDEFGAPAPVAKKTSATKKTATTEKPAASTKKKGGQGASIVDSEEEDPKPVAAPKPTGLAGRLAAQGKDAMGALSKFGFTGGSTSTTTTKTTTTTKSKKLAFSDSDDDFVVTAPAKKTASGNKKTTTSSKYMVDDDSESEW